MILGSRLLVFLVETYEYLINSPPKHHPQIHLQFRKHRRAQHLIKLVMGVVARLAIVLVYWLKLRILGALCKRRSYYLLP